MKRKLLLGLLILPLFLAFSASTAFSAIIYDNGAPDWAYGQDLSRSVSADDFVLDAETTLTDVHFWTFEGYNAGIGGNPWDGTLEYYLFEDASGEPGAQITSGLGQNVWKSDSLGWTSGDGYHMYEYSFDLAIPELLSAGTYWLGLHLASDYAENDSIYWVSTGTGSGAYSSSSQGGTFNNWSRWEDFQLAFSLTDDAMAVPEPATILLLGSGLIGLGFFRRKEEV